MKNLRNGLFSLVLCSALVLVSASNLNAQEINDNIGFNGIGGDFVATFYIKAVTNNTKVHIDICDVDPTDGVYITATTSWKKMTLYFKDVNSYTDVSSGWNGFMDFENLDNTDTIYIR